ncbi:MAG: hypothetical protein WBP85_04655 [Terracidiphilus sp.]
MESTISYAVPPNSLRIWHGFRNQTLTEQAYKTTLGQTFMPGTPYMLAPLGLAAYLPGVIVGEKSPDVPNEFAIIAYPSQQVWSHIMNDTLRGRVYSSTHGGVYDLQRSGASFPVALKHLPEMATDPYYLFDGSTDWQTGTTKIFVGAPADNTVTGNDFRHAVRQGIEAIVKNSNAIDQCIVMPGDAFVVIWVHSETAFDIKLPDWSNLGPKVRTIAHMDSQRVICRSEPPTVTLDQTLALNFVFLRAAENFLS